MSVEMEILIEDIPEDGLEISATEADGWFGEIVRDVLGNAFEKEDHASLKVRATRVNGNVDLDGEFDLTFHPDCDRCLKHYRTSNRVPFHTVLAPLYESERQREREENLEVELVKEDLEFGFYEGDRVDLAEIVREQILLSRPMKNLCSDDCKGLCPRCGKNLNEGPCSCPSKEPDSRWAALKNMKIN